MKEPVVSVLMTAFNREKYIGTAIESVLNSTFNDFELIITDDQSTDNTLDICNDYAHKDKRLIVVRNETNLGDYPNRNKAASLASGKYLKYVDADDLIYPWGLELLVKMMEEHPTAGWGLCSLEQNNDAIFPILLTPAEAYRYHYFGTGLFNKAPLSSIIRKDVFESNGGFSGRRMVGDFEMWHKLAQKNNVLLMPHGMVWYRKHSEQEMKSYNNFFMDYLDVRVIFLTSDDCPLQIAERKKLLTDIRKIIIKRFLSRPFAIRKIELNKARNLMSSLNRSLNEISN
ncbi:glycosyltransferase family 2 protein [Flavihumibacter sp. ZG627]|uniref:glycosyltransferase family 2 protein n=1 Tax=Flavihumibacter sp. ZG627 TaxID=1463156 RepID=UPI000693902D|nr:glycosyltransferase family 2 protein [Flavihumibacter sp. ZG627]